MSYEKINKKVNNLPRFALRQLKKIIIIQDFRTARKAVFFSSIKRKL